MSNRIPNHFHFVFGLRPQTEAFHLVYYLCIESCIEVNKPERIFFYYHHEPYGRYWDLIREKLTLVQVELVPAVSEFTYTDAWIRKYYQYAHHADFIRIARLIEHGGVYADMDTIFVNPLPGRLYHESTVMGEEDPIRTDRAGQPERSICNAVIMAEKGAEFCRRVYEVMASELDGSWSNHSCQLIGAMSMERPELIHVEPSRSFYKHMWTKTGIRTLLQGLDDDYDGVYSMHLWSHLWWRRLRVDYSWFHGGRLTERFVRKVDTTYNLVARRFLPPPRRRFFLVG